MPIPSRATAALLLTFAALASGSARAQANEPELVDRRGERYTQLLLDGNFAGSSTSGTGYGGGVALRVGHALPISKLVIVPELGVDFFAFSGKQETSLYGGFAGVRLRRAGPVEPGLFAHAGALGVNRDRDYVAPCLDVGLSAEVTFRERLLVGIQGQFKSAIGTGENPNFNWYTLGLMVGSKL